MAVIYYKNGAVYSPVNGLYGFSSLNGAIFGDSFIAGRNGNTGGLTSYPINETVNGLLHTNLENGGLLGGIGYCAPVQGETAYDVIHRTDVSDYDLAILAYGVNDYAYPIGDDSTPGTVMYELYRCVDEIFTKSPKVQLLIVAPWKTNRAYNESPVGYDHSRKQLADAMQTFCAANYLPFISMAENPINNFNAAQMIGSDTRHPTDHAYKMLGRWMAGQILKVIG